MKKLILAKVWKAVYICNFEGLFRKSSLAIEKSNEMNFVQAFLAFKSDGAFLTFPSRLETTTK